MKINNSTWQDDKDYFWDKHSARLDKMDDETSEPPIEVLPTFTDEDGVVWQLPHDSGWARICFDALMDGGVMTVTYKLTVNAVWRGGRLQPHEQIDQTVSVKKLDSYWEITTNDNIVCYPSSETHRVFVMAVGLRYDFGGVVLC